MKLTEMQVKALKAVERGEVSLHHETWPDFRDVVRGAKETAVWRLVKMGLVSAPAPSKNPHIGDFAITTAGHAALEELQRGQE